MKKEEKWTPHIIAVVCLVVFIVLGLACASTQLPDPLVPEGTTEIKNNAFKGKLGDYKIQVPNNIIVIPYGVQRIGKRAFYGNDFYGDTKRAYHVVIPDTVTEIGDEAFRHCNLFKTFIPDSVKTVGKDAFDSNKIIIRGSELPGEYIGDYKVDIKNGAATITRYRGNEKEVAIPAEINGIPVTAIGQYAFNGKMLTGVTIPDTVRTIGDYAFRFNKLESLVIQDTVKTIGDAAFAFNNLKRLTLPDDVRISESSFNAAFNQDVASIPGVTSITVREINASQGSYKASGWCSIDGYGNKIQSITLKGQKTFTVKFSLHVPNHNNTEEVSFGGSFNMDVYLVKGHNYELSMLTGTHAVSVGWFWPSASFRFTDLTTREEIFSKRYVVEPVWGGRARLIEQ